MEYNFEKIGKRIKKEREDNGFKSQAKLIAYLNEKYAYPMGRNRLSKIENGNVKAYDFELMERLCEIFDCEMGYLLCEYDCKTGRNTDIQKEIGLSENAIKLLRKHENSKGFRINNFLSFLIESKEYADIIINILECRTLATLEKEIKDDEALDLNKSMQKANRFDCARLFGNVINDYITLERSKKIDELLSEHKK